MDDTKVLEAFRAAAAAFAAIRGAKAIGGDLYKGYYFFAVEGDAEFYAIRYRNAATAKNQNDYSFSDDYDALNGGEVLAIKIVKMVPAAIVAGLVGLVA